MARPSNELISKYLTTAEAAGRLKMRRQRLKNRIRAHQFPKAPFIDETGCAAFTEQWVRMAKLIILCEKGKITQWELRNELIAMGYIDEDASRSTPIEEFEFWTREPERIVTNDTATKSHQP